MRYRSILIPLGHAADLQQRVQIAAYLAARDNAGVIGLATTGVSNVMSDQLPLLTEGAALQRLAQLAQQYGIAHTQQVQVDDAATSAPSCHGNAADLIILGRSEIHGGEALSAGCIASGALMVQAHLVRETA